MEFIASFAQYVIIMIILAALAVGGVFFGKFLRNKKDEKAVAKASGDTNE